MKNIIYTLGLLLAVSPVHTLSAQTVISSLIKADETWSPSGNPYLLNANALIEDSVTVTIKPGTIVKATGKYKLYIDGELIAKGTKDSAIVFDTLTFEFTAKAKGYDFNTNSGSEFNYCYFNGDSYGGTYEIKFPTMDLLIRNSKFENCYYCVYCTSTGYDTNIVKIQNTIFRGAGNYYGYAYYSYSGRYNFLEMDGCLVENMYGLYLANYSKITRSTFYNIKSYSGISINAYNANYFGRVIMACNTFRKFDNTIIDLNGVPTTGSFVFNNNTLDSANYLMDISLSTSANTKFYMYIHDNNFLKAYKNTILLSGTRNLGKADTLDFQQNYWADTTLSVIGNGVRDFNDDITIGGIIDYTNPRSAAVTDCVIQNPFEEQHSSNVYKPALGSFTLSPNPANSQFTVNTATNGFDRLHIYNLAGKCIYTTEVNQLQTVVNTDQLQAGMYLVQLSGKNLQSQSVKLLIQK